MAGRRISLFKIAVLVFIIIFLTGTGVTGYFLYSMVGMDELPEADIALTTKFFDGSGNLLTTLYRENRFDIPLEDIPLELQQAVISVEDSYFYNHHGINLMSIGRAALRNIKNRRIVEGGSTITQQLAKNLFLTHERTFNRKIEELILTIHLERKYTKDEILNMYLNIIYLGHGAHGVEAAAQEYFGKTVKDLTLAESAMIAGLTRGPGYYSPFIDEAASRNRQVHVLNRMVEMGYISQAQKEEALNEELILRTRTSSPRPAAYFIDYVIYRELIGKLDIKQEDIYRNGLNVYTTLDPSVQKAAEKVLQEELEVFPGRYQDEQGVMQPQGALVAIDPKTGYVKALAGGLDYKQTNFNRAISMRSPGSAFKPFLYAAALDSGYTPATLIKCEQVTIPIQGSSQTWEPTDFGGTFHNRNLTLREAVAKSCNVCAAKIIMDLGPQKVVNYAKMMGIESSLNPVPSLALGTSEVTALEMAAAFTALANRGIKADPVFVTKITDAHGRILWENNTRQQVVLDEKVAYLLTDILKDVIRPGGTASQISHMITFPAAGKTGTSNEYRDAYMVGYTPNLVASVYVGDDHYKTLGQSGGRLAAPIWGRFMASVMQNYPVEDFHHPEGIIELSLCAETGLLQSSKCNGPSLTERNRRKNAAKACAPMLNLKSPKNPAGLSTCRGSGIKSLKM